MKSKTYTRKLDSILLRSYIFAEATVTHAWLAYIHGHLWQQWFYAYALHAVGLYRYQL